MVLDLFFNDLDAAIDEGLAEIDPLFTPSAILRPISYQFANAHTDRNPLSIEQLAFSSCRLLHYVRRNFFERK